MMTLRIRRAWATFTTKRVPTETLWLVLAVLLIVAFVVVVVAVPISHR
ncbi:MAG TPA: hypothetical protein VGA22_06930 [Gemmatimonadales bacterium]|jgi:uncharacterized membrane protein YidH (DUF202 family)